MFLLVFVVASKPWTHDIETSAGCRPKTRASRPCIRNQLQDHNCTTNADASNVPALMYYTNVLRSYTPTRLHCFAPQIINQTPTHESLLYTVSSKDTLRPSALQELLESPSTKCMDQVKPMIKQVVKKQPLSFRNSLGFTIGPLEESRPLQQK